MAFTFAINCVPIQFLCESLGLNSSVDLQTHYQSLVQEICAEVCQSVMGSQRTPVFSEKQVHGRVCTQQDWKMLSCHGFKTSNCLLSFIDTVKQKTCERRG